MTSDRPATWHIERTAEMRADAPSLFVPRDDLPDAAPGDRVDVSGAGGGDDRTGTVVELVDDPDRGRFVVIDFDDTQREADAIEER